MKSYLKVLTAVISLAVFTFAFQNCGDEVAFSGDTSASYSKIDGNPVPVTEGEAEEELEEFFEELPQDPTQPGDPGSKEPGYYSSKCRLAKLLVRGRKATNGSITDFRGNMIIAADKLDLVENVRGNLIIVGVGSTNSIEIMNNVRGNKLLCGLSIGTMTEVRGNTILVNGALGDIDDHRGNLVLIQSDHTGSVSNIRGNFVQF